MGQIAKSAGTSEEHAEYLFVRHELDKLQQILESLEQLPQKNKESVEKLFLDEVNAYKKQLIEKQQQQIKQKEEADVVNWTQEEIELLTRAMVKFPVGTRNRWDRIREFLGETKTVKQIIAKVKKTGPSNPSAKLEDQYEKWMKTKKETVVLSEPSKNWEAEAREADSPQTASPAAAKSPAPNSPQTTTSPAAAKSPEAAKPKEWSADEQKSLEAALKKYPASLGTDRWAKIAIEVPGRTKKECLDRYKYIVSIIKQAKTNK